MTTVLNMLDPFRVISHAQRVGDARLVASLRRSLGLSARAADTDAGDSVAARRTLGRLIRALKL